MALTAPAIKFVVDEEPRSLEAFFKKHKFFVVPWVILAAALYSMRFVPQLQAYFVAHNLKPLGIVPATSMAIWCIMCGFAMHGWIAANHDELVKKGLKHVRNVPYNWKSGDSSIRSSLIFFFGMTAYAQVPMRMAPAETWGAAISEFLVGYLILLVAGDFWFYLCHLSFHTHSLYKHAHKTHHTWKHPVAFSAYYIASCTHFIQEHVLTIPAMMFLPIPWNAFWFYQYYGVPVAQMQHCGFRLEELTVPFCGSLKIGHVMSACGLGLGYILGSQNTAEHDYHHETFIGNYQLSYTYLDRLFGTYVDRKEMPDLEDCHKNEYLLAAD